MDQNRNLLCKIIIQLPRLSLRLLSSGRSLLTTPRIKSAAIIPHFESFQEQSSYTNLSVAILRVYVASHEVAQLQASELQALWINEVHLGHQHTTVAESSDRPHPRSRRAIRNTIH